MAFCNLQKKLSVLLAILTSLLQLSFASAETKPLHPASFDVVGINKLKSLNPQLDGGGVKISVISRSFDYIDGIPQNNYLCDIFQECLSNANISFDSTPGIPAYKSEHSTNVCSILFGSDPNAYNPEIGDFNFRGAVPNANANVCEFWHFLSNYVFEDNDFDTDLITASFGSHFESWWTRGIDALAEHESLPVIAAIGNGEHAFDTAMFPGAGANVIGVGVVDSVSSNKLYITLTNFGLAKPEHSSTGPTFDRRCKPDIVAPGNCLVPAANENSEYYPSGNWSSYAAPTVAGAAALLIQKAKLNKTNLDLISSTGGNCIIKTILLNSATKLPFWHKGLLTKDDDHSVPLDYIQGAGLLNAVKAHDILDAGRQEAGFVKNIGWDKNRLEIDKEFEKVYHIHLDNPEKKIITATAAWNLHYNKKYPFEITEEKNSNLSLELWALDVNDPNRSLLIDYSDSYVDNVEHIHCKTDPNFTDYDLVISYSTNESIDIQNEGEDYAIAWNIDESPAEKQDILWYDLDTNGIVDEKDLEIIFGFAKAVLESGSDISFGDINGDGKIDLDDISILFEQNNRQAKWFND